MKSGLLSQYFEAVAVKTLSAVEVNKEKSNQHEFNGSKELKAVLKTEEKSQLTTKFMWIEDENAALAEDGFVTWYNSRENKPHRSAEFRLYFATNGVMNMATEGDKLFIARRTDNTMLIIITPADSTIERQLYWLFGLAPQSGDSFELASFDITKDQKLDFTNRFILEELEIEVEEPENDRIDALLTDFSRTFPDTDIFSSFARKTLQQDYNVIDDPDDSILLFMDWEEKLFKRLERHILAERLSKGFLTTDGQDVEGFLGYSLSIQNRRKRRAGLAFENHVEYIFNQNKLLFSRKGHTENKSKPDFLFPGLTFYKDEKFPSAQLTMLGLKTSCKDRWRQILSEAAKIKEKHLLTLEPGISEHQTNEMQANHVQLVVPKIIHNSFTSQQQSYLFTVKDFITLASTKQKHITIS